MTKLLIGLGNPGEEYNSSRHNIGFIMIDKIAENLSINFDNHKKKFFICENEKRQNPVYTSQTSNIYESFGRVGASHLKII